MTFWKRQNYEDSKKKGSVIAKDWAGGGMIRESRGFLEQ